MKKNEKYKWKLKEVLPNLTDEEMRNIINQKLVNIIIRLEEYYKNNKNNNESCCENH